jgi:hypothetical protein
MRKILFILLGLFIVFICLLAIKVYDITQTPVPTTLEKPVTVDSLIEHLLYEDEHRSHRTTWTASMDDLVRIGEPTVLKLIEAIETAHDRALSMNYGNVQRSE